MRSKQHGVTLISWLVIIAVAGLLGTAGLRLIPVYLENYKVTSSLRSVRGEYAGQSPTPGKLRVAVGKRFDIESVNAIKRADVQITRRGNLYVVRAKYEHRVPFIGNVFFLVDFDDSVEVPL